MPSFFNRPNSASSVNNQIQNKKDFYKPKFSNWKPEQVPQSNLTTTSTTTSTTTIPSVIVIIPSTTSTTTTTTTFAVGSIVLRNFSSVAVNINGTLVGSGQNHVVGSTASTPNGGGTTTSTTTTTTTQFGTTTTTSTTTTTTSAR